METISGVWAKREDEKIRKEKNKIRIKRVIRLS
jgi:hypothetical protein